LKRGFEVMAKFELIVVDGKTYPAAITNYSLSFGEKIGLLGGSNLTDILETDSIMHVIYLSLIGVHSNFSMNYDDFLGIFKGKEIGKEILIEIYTRLTNGAIEKKPNQFAKGFQLRTSNKVEKGQKKIKPPKVKFECAEDRYVWYCMINGIDSDIFWYHPIPDVERILEGKQAYDGWKSNPQ
jgi:hypothetical protein